MQGTLLVIRDVTEQRRLEQIAAAAVVSDSVGYFFAGIRHELGNPVNSLKAALTLLVDPLVQLPDDRRQDYLRRALAEVSRMRASSSSCGPSARTRRCDRRHRGARRDADVMGLVHVLR